MYLHNSKRSKHERNDYHHMYNDDRNAATKYLWSPLSTILIAHLLVGGLAILSRLTENSTNPPKPNRPRRDPPRLTLIP